MVGRVGRRGADRRLRRRRRRARRSSTCRPPASGRRCRRRPSRRRAARGRRRSGPSNSGGDGQAAKAAPSSEHSKVEPGSVEEKPKLAVVLGGGRRPGRRRSSSPGASASTTVHVRLAGVGSMLPLMSTACTRNVCVPTLSSGQPMSASGNTAGDRHSTNGSPSSEHSNVGAGLAGGERERRRSCSRSCRSGRPRIVVSGGLRDLEAVLGRDLAGDAVLVDRADLEDVLAVEQVRCTCAATCTAGTCSGGTGSA